PGIDEETVSEIIATREIDPFLNENPARRHETWLLTEGIVDLDQMKQLIPLVSAGGDVYRAQIVGYFDEGGPAARIEAIIDSSRATPRLVFWRDISHLGRGYSLDTLGQTVVDDAACGFPGSSAGHWPGGDPMAAPSLLSSARWPVIPSRLRPALQGCGKPRPPWLVTCKPSELI